MKTDDPTLCFEFNEAAIGLMYQSVSHYLEQWPGGTDPLEQVALFKLKTLFASALMEYTYNRTD